MVKKACMNIISRNAKGILAIFIIGSLCLTVISVSGVFHHGVLVSGFYAASTLFFAWLYFNSNLVKLKLSDDMTAISKTKYWQLVPLSILTLVVACIASIN